MDNEMNMRIHIGKICSACYFHLRRLRQLRHNVSKATMQRLVSAFILSRLDYCNSVLAGPAATLAPMQRLVSAFILSRLDYCNSLLAGLPTATLASMQRLVSAFILSRLDYCNSVLAGLPAATLAPMQRLVSAFVLSRLDYCNSVLAGLPAANLAPMQRVMNDAVRLVAGLHMRDHVTPVMRLLHWLPIKFRIRYKFCILMHAAVNYRSPEYINKLLVPVSTLDVNVCVPQRQMHLLYQ